MARVCWLSVLLALFLVGCVAVATPPADDSGATTSPAQATPQLVLAQNLAVVDRQDPTQPPLLLPQGDSYQLEPGWQLASITYVYKWWGLAEPIFDMQSITRQGDGYVRGEAAVDAAHMASFLMTLRELYPTQQALSAINHTDDYPSWQVELLGTDGRRILLTSQSNAYPYGAPWNVMHNGRLYAQYSGSIGAALATLFPSNQGVPAGNFWPEGMGAEPQMAFASSDLPPQLRYGFDGLLPIADSFSYQTDPSAGTLTGVIEGRGSIGGFGNMVIGTLTGLEGVALALEDGTTLPCAVEPIETEDVLGALWEFSCPVAGKPVGERYRFPITVEMSNDRGIRVPMEGVLHGIWGEREPLLVLPMPIEIERALRADPASATLLDALPISQIRYDGVMETPNPLFGGRFVGELLLVGETTHEGRALRYGVGTSFEIEEGLLTRWPLSEERVETMLTEALALPITQQLLTRATAPLVLLGYEELFQETDPLPLMNGNNFGQSWAVIPTCLSGVEERYYPTEDAPLRKVTVIDGEQWLALTLVDGRPVVTGAHLKPAVGWLPILPPAGVEGEPLSFGLLEVTAGGSPPMNFSLPEEGRTERQEAYIEQLLPLFSEQKNVDAGESSWGWEGALHITETGELQLVSCME